MRWFARRLAFYVFAIWVALTINFLLPRLMPGDPLAGILQHLSPSQVQANPGIVQTYKVLLGGDDNSIWHDYFVYLGRIVHLDFGISTSNYPATVGEVIGKTLPYSIFLVGVAFLLSFVIGISIGMFAAWRRGKTVDNTLVPAFMVLGAFPAFFTALLFLYVFGLQLHWFPIQHAYASDVVPAFSWEFISSALRHAQLPIIIIVLAFTGGWVLNMRTVMINTIGEDYVTMAHAKGLRDRRVMTRYAGRNAILPPLNGFAPLFASAVGGLVFIEFIFSYPGAGFTLQQAVLGNDYALAQGLLVVLSLCVIFANLFMDIFNFVLDPRLRTG